MTFPKKDRDFFIFENLIPGSKYDKSYFFEGPLEIIQAASADEVPGCFERIEKLSEKYFIAGYFAYELGFCLEGCLRGLLKKKLSRPLIYLGVFRTAGRSPLNLLSTTRKKYLITNLKPSEPFGRYSAKIDRIKNYIAQGDAYQVNYTMRYEFDIEGSKSAFYSRLKKNQPVEFAAYLKIKDTHIMSLSPELFFRRENSFIESKPMKGTIERGVSKLTDSLNKNSLRSDPKNKAENLMIVDLLRNDIGKFARTGSVRVERLWDVETYKTLHQMTSTVSGAVSEGASYLDIFKAIFPCASVTGAPKIRAMQIIDELEKRPRGVYCGALGIFMPHNRCVFSVPIRTVEIAGRKGTMGIGGGIVADSVPEEEYRECLLKGGFLASAGFNIFESILWNKKYRMLAMHLGRMRKSARRFGFAFDMQKARKLLREGAKSNTRGKLYKVKLLLDAGGALKIEKSVIDKPDKGAVKKALLCAERVDERNEFLRHKTTNREFYERCLGRCAKKGYYDAVFLNSRGEVTEGAYNNIFVKILGRLYTPPLSSGILPGILRQKMLDSTAVKVRKIYPEDLIKSRCVYLGNSVRGLVKVKIEGIGSIFKA